MQKKKLLPIVLKYVPSLRLYSMSACPETERENCEDY